MSTADAIMSIYPEYADAILSGAKTIELRRRVPALSAGTRLWIYATRPESAIVGFVTVQDVTRACPQEIWDEHKMRVAVDYDTFSSYFNGTGKATAILLESAKPIEPIDVDRLRDIRDSFHPPRVLTRLTDTEASALWKLVSPRQV